MHEFVAYNVVTEALNGRTRDPHAPVDTRHVKKLKRRFGSLRGRSRKDKVAFAVTE